MKDALNSVSLAMRIWPLFGLDSDFDVFDLLHEFDWLTNAGARKISHR